MKNKIISLSLLGLLLLPIVSLAVEPTKPEEVANFDYDKMVGLITKAGGWIQGILLTLAALFVIIGAFFYLTAGGDAEKTKKGKGYIMGAVIAVVIALLATGLIALVKKFIGAV